MDIKKLVTGYLLLGLGAAAVQGARLLLLLSLASCGAARHEEPPIAHVSAVQSCLESAGPSFLAKSITVAFEGVQLPQVIGHLHTELGLPVSFIEGPPPVQVELSVEGQPVRTLLGQLLHEARDYRCAVVRKHVVIYHDEPALHKLVEDVSIDQELRGRAAGSYVKYLSRQVEEFEHLGVLLVDRWNHRFSKTGSR